MKEDRVKALEFDEKLCDLDDAYGCAMSALTYDNKIHETENKKEAKEFKIRAAKYYKKLVS